MRTNAKRQAEQTPQPTSYRCPACGQMVNNNDLTAVRWHHRHVLQPQLDGDVSYLPIAFANKSSAEDKPAVSSSRNFADPSLGKLFQNQDVSI